MALEQRRHVQTRLCSCCEAELVKEAFNLLSQLLRLVSLFQAFSGTANQMAITILNTFSA